MIKLSLTMLKTYFSEQTVDEKGIKSVYSVLQPVNYKYILVCTCGLFYSSNPSFHILVK